MGNASESRLVDYHIAAVTRVRHHSFRIYIVLAVSCADNIPAVAARMWSSPMPPPMPSRPWPASTRSDADTLAGLLLGEGPDERGPSP